MRDEARQWGDRGVALVRHAWESARVHAKQHASTNLPGKPQPALEANIGNDGLTDSERLEALVRFRAGVGSKPAYTEEFAARAELIQGKLVGHSHTPSSSPR